MDRQILAHGGGGGTVDLLIGIAPVLLGVVLLGAFVLLLQFDRANHARAGYRDHTPTSARLLFSGTYYQMEEWLERDSEELRPQEPVASGNGSGERRP